MKKRLEFNGKWVLLTGASSGLGREIAKQLATRQGANLILVARRLDRLETLQAELKQLASIQCLIIKADLTKAEDQQRIFDLSTDHCRIDGVIFNAGITYFGSHSDISSALLQNILATNVESTVKLATLFIPYFLEKKHDSSMVFISSLAGLIPLAYQAVYSASKAFILSFAQSIYQELVNEPLSITVVAPGGLITEMTEKTGLANHFSGTRQMQLTSDCASEVIYAMTRRKYLYIPGFFNRFQYFMSHFLPRRLVGRLVASAYKNVPFNKV